MTLVETHLYRLNDHKLVRLSITLGYKGIYDRCIISFRHGKSILNPVATSTGAIQNNQISIISGDTRVAVDLEHVNNLEQIESLVSYLQGDDLAHSESVIAYVEKSASIDTSTATVTPVVTSSGDYRHRMAQFYESLKRRVSPWRIQLDVEDDIIGHVKSHSPNKVFITFGEVSQVVLASDFIFSADPHSNKIVIPKELFWKNYDMYSTNAKIAFCEIVKPDFCSVDVFYKCPISNSVPMSSLPRKLEAHLSGFKLPTGVSMGERWKLDKGSNMPVYAG